MNLEEMTLLARCNGLHTQTFRAGCHLDGTIRAKKIQFIDHNLIPHEHQGCLKAEPFVNYYDPDLFRTMVQATCKIEGLYSIVNFGRKELQQTGDGHFACLGGYHPKTEKVLLMDTARYKYPPFWVDIQDLYESVRSLDKDSGKMRGFLVLSKKSLSSANLINRLPPQTPKVRFMSDLSLEQTRELIKILNTDEIKIYIFKFLHDLYSMFGGQQKAPEAVGQQYLGNGYLSAEFFE